MPSEPIPATIYPSAAPPYTLTAAHLADCVEHRNLVAVGYTRVRELGRGAFGTVWEATDDTTGERVAIKFFVAGRDEWKSLLDEVRLLQSVEGTFGIVNVKQVRPGDNDRASYYVMSLARGGSLASRLEKAGGRLPLVEAVRLFMGVVKALAFVHQHGILHCDLKPANVLLNEAGDPLLADFGQAHLVSDVSSPSLGTMFYMAPEQARTATIVPDTRWDVYALGALLHTLLSGEPPRKSEAMVRQLHAANTLEKRLAIYRAGLQAVPDARGHRAYCDRLLARLIERCLALDPAERPADAGAVMQSLQARRRWRRSRPVRIGVSFAVGLLVAATFASWWSVSQKSEARAVAEAQKNLYQTAWVGRNLVEGKLQGRVLFLQREAEMCPPEMRALLAHAAEQLRPAADPRDAVKERGAFQDWLDDVYLRLNADSPGETKSVGLFIAANDRAFLVARVRNDGSRENPFDEANRELYTADWSFRDYYRGVGHDYPNRGKPHAREISGPHISDTYLSRAKEQKWLLDVSVPVFESADKLTVVLLVSGLDLYADILVHLRLPDEATVDETRFTIVNDRGHWAWNEAGQRKLERIARDNPNDLTKWLPPGDEFEEEFRPLRENRATKFLSDEFLDRADPASERQAACGVIFQPYPARGQGTARKSWALVTHANRSSIVEPVRHESNLLGLQLAILVLAMVMLASGLGLWVARAARNE